MLNEIKIDDFNIVEDTEMKLALFNFFNTKDLVRSSALKHKHLYISYFKNIKLSDLTRLTFGDIWNSIKSKKNQLSLFSKTHINFLGFLLKNNLYKGDDLEELIPFTTLLYTSTSNSTYNNSTFLDKKRTVDNFFVYSYPDRSSSGTGLTYYMLIDINCENTFIVNLLDEFYKSSSFSKKTRNINFALSFLNSDSNIKNFCTISDFTYKVFKNQFEYFKDKPPLTKELIKFYLYLYELSGFVNFFKPNDPIDTNMLQRPDFIQLVKDGYMLVNYNTFEEPPSFDRWLLKPNGFEETTTQLKHDSYSKVDFSIVKNKVYTPYLKQYFWDSTVNLSSRKQWLFRIIDFLDFLTDYKMKSIDAKNNNIDFESISAVEVYSYRGHVETMSIGAKTKNTIYHAIKDFLNYCINKNYLSIQNGVFDYLGGHTTSSGDGGLDIPEDELIKLEEQLRKNSEDDITRNLYYIIFHMAIETEFRISQLTSLKISYIKEGMKTNQFFIHSITKTSNADKEMQAITLYAKRHLDIAIKHTEELRKNATPDFKDYIFLAKKNANNKDISPIEPQAFNDYLKKQCRELGIKEYTASNLRDTHMTKAVEYGFKQGLNPMQMGTLTNHAKTSTTNNHYVNYKIRTFAEATFGVTIGDVDIKGTILNTTNETFSKEDVVDNGCGFCKENACKIKSELGCPMCDGFVVTLDRIPFYELRIKEIDAMIDNESIAHEREHLHTIKRLYVAYLERLYTLLEEVSN